MRIHNFSRAKNKEAKGSGLKTVLKWSVFAFLAFIALRFLVLPFLFIAFLSSSYVFENYLKEINWTLDPCFEVVDGKGGEGYSIKEGRVCIMREDNAIGGGWDPRPRWIMRSLEGADGATFVDLGRGFGKDAKRVYWKDKVVEGADPDSFSPFWWNLGKDRDHVYSEDKVLPLDSAMLKVWEDEYISDNRSVFSLFYDPKKMEGADGATFASVGKGFGKDKEHVYWKGRVIERADPKTFSVLSPDVSKDANHVFFEDKIIADADPMTFRLLSKYLARDQKHIFAAGRVIEGADPDTFRSIPKDEGPNAHTHEDYYRDKNAVFTANSGGWSERVEGVDVETLHWVDYLYLQDKNHCYDTSDDLDIVPNKECKEAAEERS
jgi:hypothetical protein